MKNKRYLLLAFMIVFALSGCGGISGNTAGNTPTPVQPSLMPELPTALVVAAGTAELVGTIVPVPMATSPAGTPAPITFPPGGGLIVGLPDQGRMVIMHVGDRFLLQLGDFFDWTVTSSDIKVVARVPNITVIRGAQGLYEGLKAGEATLTAIGEPTCRSANPPCMTPSISFTIQVQVEP